MTATFQVSVFKKGTKEKADSVIVTNLVMGLVGVNATFWQLLIFVLVLQSALVQHRIDNYYSYVCKLLHFT